MKCVALACVVGIVGGAVVCPEAHADPPTVEGILGSATGEAELRARLLRYVPVDLGLDMDSIDPALRPMLAPLLEAADHIDRVYWQQHSPEGLVWRDALEGSSNSHAKALVEMLNIHYGPWDWHHDDHPFLGSSRRPPGAAFYPQDLSSRELDAYGREHPEVLGGLWSPYTRVERQNGGLTAVPYSKAYGGDLAKAADALRRAAGVYGCQGDGCPCAGLVRFLRSRADAFASDDYRPSEMDWMNTGACPLDIAIGPYEFYTDRLAGMKTAFEAIVYYRDESQSARYARLAEHRPGLVANLPVSAALRERLQGTAATPITVADVLYTAGDARAGYQVRAFMLPNDPIVRRDRGAKKVILVNVAMEKFKRIVQPLAHRVFSAEAAAKVSFEAYFDFLLAWNLAHSLVPEAVELPSGAMATARQKLRNRYQFVESVRGEAVGLLNYLYLEKGGALERGDPEAMAATYLATLLDSVRLAEGTPQSIGKIIVYNYLASEWVFRYNPRTRAFEVNAKNMLSAVMKLTREALEIIARGDYDGAGRLIVRHGIMPPEMRTMIGELDKEPLDLRPRYTAARR